MKAYKVFDKEWKCRGFQYEVGKTYEMEEDPVLCERGFHACIRATDCFNYKTFSPDNKVAEVELLGKIIQEDGGDKQVTNKIRIVREVPWAELLTLVNTGNGCSGLGNSGDRNSGNGNSGDRNSGNGNSGDWNSGAWNSGDRNSGDRNSGDRNSGNGNSGDRNSGAWNSGNGNSGFFNTDKPAVRIFNKETSIPRSDINFPSFLYFGLTFWVSKEQASKEEIEEHKEEIETSGGFLRTLEYKEAFQKAWEGASEGDRQMVKDLPNFDADIFFEISGIRV